MIRCLPVLLVLACTGCATLTSQAPPAPPAANATLADCPPQPRCADSRGTGQQVPAWTYRGRPERARAVLLDVLRAAERVTPVAQGPHWLQATASTGLWQFTDDLQFLFSAPGTIAVRSAARIGWYDWGTNARRLERLRLAFDAAMDGARSGRGNAVAAVYTD